nr:zinc finger, CCHC-type [Tanacetum cinerariifolium]
MFKFGYAREPYEPVQPLSKCNLYNDEPDVGSLNSQKRLHSSSDLLLISMSIYTTLTFQLDFCRRYIDLESHWRDLQLEVHRERYSRSKLLFQNLQILFKVDFDLGFKGLRLSSFARVLGFIKVSNDDTVVAQRRLEDKQLEEKKNTDCLVKEQEKVHLIIKVGANITVIGVPGQEGTEGNVAEKKKVKESMKANLRKLLNYKAWLTRWSPV